LSVSIPFKSKFPVVGTEPEELIIIQTTNGPGGYNDCVTHTIKGIFKVKK
jgi:hypothetical protein